MVQKFFSLYNAERKNTNIDEPMDLVIADLLMRKIQETML